MIRVMSARCATCIFRPGNLMDLREGRLQELVEGCLRSDGFVICHDTTQQEGGDLVAGSEAAGAICRGFFDAYDTTPLQLARRLPEFVEWVDGASEEDLG